MKLIGNSAESERQTREPSLTEQSALFPDVLDERISTGRYRTASMGHARPRS
jgi:hypothetical protein